jgi:hypothetical protein
MTKLSRLAMGEAGGLQLAVGPGASGAGAREGMMRRTGLGRRHSAPQERVGKLLVVVGVMMPQRQEARRVAVSHCHRCECCL